LFPAIPFYNYKKVFNKSEKELRELDLPVFDIVVTDL
jgi:fatty acid desaturase